MIHELVLPRPISALLTFNKLQEPIICEMISDMSANLDSTQYGNRKRTGIQHYLVKLLHRILSETDKNSRRQIKAVICNFVDWKQVYSRQSHILGIRSFIANGVRPSLIPVLTDYFKSMSMKVKWGQSWETGNLIPKLTTTLTLFRRKTVLNLSTICHSWKSRIWSTSVFPPTTPDSKYQMTFRPTARLSTAPG